MKLFPTVLFLLIVFVAGGPRPSARAQGDQLASDIRLFTVLAALNAAGYDDGFGSPSAGPVRRALREDLKDFQGSSLQRLTNLYSQFKLDDPGQNLSQFVSFALATQGPPDFEIRAELPTDLPPDVRRLRSAAPLMAEFYREARIEALWSKYQAAFDREIERYQEPLIEALFEAAGYLRVSPTSRQAQSFQVFFDLLGAPNNINTRGYGGKVYVVVHPSKEPRIDEIRHAFLLHLLDPLSIRHAEEISKKEILSRFALFAPALGEIYKSNFQLLVTKCLVKAVEARLARVSRAERQDRVQRDLREGLVLTPYFYESLAKFEKQGQAMRYYYPELIKGIDLKREAARLQEVKFAAAPTRPPRQAIRPNVSETDILLRDAELSLQAERPEEARKKLVRVLDLSGGENAQASYALGRAALLEGDPDLARSHLQEALESDPDTYVRAMSHLYIGRIEDVLGNREQAVEHYELALAAGEPSERIRQLAQEGIEQRFGRPRGEDEQEYEEE